LVTDETGDKTGLGRRIAFDALVWFGGLIEMATLLGNMDVIKWFSELVAEDVKGWARLPALGLLLLVYVYNHYGFAGQTVHISVMFLPLLAVAIAAGAPPLLAAPGLAFFSNLNLSLTHYANGPAVT
jgi:divalent anion:Na+ symporter, DASS family